ncbi:MAG: STAS domain-containing protein [Bacteroidota bacterium]|nr:STAS domain-containing protein [Bacteroidota bacterium]
MKVKIDTKERFYVITLMEPIFTANIAADLSQLVTKFLQQQISNVVLKMEEIENIEEKAAEELAQVQQLFYERNASFVICGLHPQIEEKLDNMELLEEMNVAPTEIEAGDIVQMEEIERELMDENIENL